MQLFLFVWRSTNPETLMKMTGLEEIKLSFAYVDTAYITGYHRSSGRPYPMCCTRHQEEEVFFEAVCRHAARRMLTCSPTLKTLNRDTQKARMSELWRYLTYDLTAK